MSISPIYIDICSTTDDPLVVDKSYSAIGQSVPIEATSIIDQENPIFIIDYNSSYLAANYIVCSTLRRKYFINKVSVNTAKRIIFTCKVDPLSSFSLGSCAISAIRNEGIGAPTMYPDPKLPVYPSKKNIGSIIMEETSGLLTANGTWCYILTVIGGTPNF